MLITPVPFTLTEYLQSKFDHADRSDGLHVSRIYGDLDRAINRKRESGIEAADLDEFAQIGFLWERILETTLADLTYSAQPERYFRPGEISVDGILMTPDYADLDFTGDGSYEMGVEEWKVTWRSDKHAEDLERNHWKWLVQIKAYCWGLACTRARLRALYLVGNWRDRIVPTPKCWELQFTQRELRDNWEMLRGHADSKGWRKIDGGK